MEKITINGVEYKLTPIENESPNSFEPKFKVGDVIFAKSKFNGDSFIRIFLKLDENKSWAHCNICSNGYFDASKGFLLLSRYDFYPATKEQRDLLFQKMKEAGYEWDAEKKELKKIEQNWCEEDKRMFDYALDMIEWYSGKNEDKSRLVSDWLKSLRPQPKQDWGKEDENRLNHICLILKCSEIATDACTNDIDWLKSIKNRIQQAL